MSLALGHALAGAFMYKATIAFEFGRSHFPGLKLTGLDILWLILLRRGGRSCFDDRYGRMELIRGRKRQSIVPRWFRRENSACVTHLGGLL